MKVFSGLRVFVFLSVALLFVGGTTDAQQISSLEVYSTVDNSERVYVGDEVTVTFLASPAGEAPLYITAENIEVISIQGASDHLGPILSSNYTTSPGGELVVTGVFTGAGNAFIHAHWDRPHPSNDLASRAVFEVRVPLPPATLEIVSGNHQHGYSGTSLQPFVVVVNDRNGKLLPGVNVAFRVIRWFGTLTSERVRTDRLGRAETTLTLGPELGVYQVEASVDGYPELTQTFTAAAIGAECEVPPEPSPPIPTKLEVIFGDDQYGESGMPLAQPFIVGVLDQYGKGLANIDVTFSVIRGSGSFSDFKTTETVKTDAYGQASVTLKLGLNVGVNLVRATLWTGLATETVTFSAVAKSDVLPIVYWIEGGAIFRFDGRSRDKLDIHFPIGWTATSLAVDVTGNKIYWTERQIGEQKGRIRTASLNGTNVKMLKMINAVPNGIVANPETRKLYWTNSRGRIQRIDFTGNDNSFRGDLIPELGIPKHIVLGVDWSATPDAIYWTAYDADKESWSISSSSLSGNIKNKDLLELGELGELSGLAVAGNKLYWAEKTVAGQGRIRCASITGGSVKTLHVLEGSIPSGIAVDAAGSSLYWTSSNGTNFSGSIQRLNLDEPIQIVVEGLGNPTGIALGSVLAAAAPARPAAPSILSESSAQNVLLANYPNPFNPETWIPYQLSEPADVTVSIYSVNGSLIRTLALGHQSTGIYQSKSRAVYWDGRNAFGERVASGLYFYTLRTGDFTATRKMLIRK